MKVSTFLAATALLLSAVSALPTVQKRGDSDVSSGLFEEMKRDAMPEPIPIPEPEPNPRKKCALASMCGKNKRDAAPEPAPEPEPEPEPQPAPKKCSIAALCGKKWAIAECTHFVYVLSKACFIWQSYSSDYLFSSFLSPSGLDREQHKHVKLLKICDNSSPAALGGTVST